MVLVPIGFISDHMEVIYDLDTEAARHGGPTRAACVRAATAGVHPAFVAGLVDLMLERARGRAGRGPTVTGRRGRASGVVRVLRWDAVRTCANLAVGRWSRRLAESSAKPLPEQGILAR